MPEENPISESVSLSRERLKAAASKLNKASDELGKVIAELDESLKRLNLGIWAWVTITSGRDPHAAAEWGRDIGYAKVGSRWGICIKEWERDYDGGDFPEQQWLFNDAPRTFRIEAIEKLPELLDKLAQEADETTEKIAAKVDYARQIAEAVQGPQSKSRRK